MVLPGRLPSIELSSRTAISLSAWGVPRHRSAQPAAFQAADPLGPRAPCSIAASILFCLCGIPLLLAIPATVLTGWQPFRRTHMPERTAGSQAASQPTGMAPFTPAVAAEPAASKKED